MKFELQYTDPKSNARAGLITCVEFIFPRK